MKKKDFFEDLGIKIVALILSLIIWFHATTEKNYTQTLELPVKYSYVLPDSFVLISKPPERVRLRISAKGKTILKLKYTKSYYLVDVGRLDMGKNIVDMTQGVVPRTENLDIIEVIPRKVLFLVDRYSTKVLYSIKPVFSRDSSLVRVSVRRVRPRTVRVRGPRTILRTMREVETDTIYVDTLKTGIYEVEVSPRTNLKYVKIIKPAKLKVKFSVKRYVYDTVEIKLDNRKFNVSLYYTDTINFVKDSLVCALDTVKNIPLCNPPEGVFIQNIIERK